MGRPINKNFFGNRNLGGAGGEGLASVDLGTAGTLYSQGLTATVSAPQLVGGVTATISPVVTVGTGAIASYTVTNPGSGYTSAPTVTLVPATTVTSTYDTGSGSTTLTLTAVSGTLHVGMRISGTGTSNQLINSITSQGGGIATVVMSATTTISGTATFTDAGASGVAGTRTLTTTASNALTISAFVTAAAGGTSAVAGDIVKQVGANTYRVTTAQGTSLCKLVAAAPAAGEMTLTATDSASATYYVTKLTKRKAFIVKGDRLGTEFADANTGGVWVRWVIAPDVAVLNESVILTSA